MTTSLPGAGALTAHVDPLLLDLLNVDDPDWEAFREDDPRWFLRAAGRAIRKYCGWHIYPNIQEDAADIRAGSSGIIMLPSRHVTSVDSLTIQAGATAQLVAVGDYIVYEPGWIQLKGFNSVDWYAAGYYYGNDPYYLSGGQPSVASCIFWHGYDTLPDDIKEIAFELAEQSMAVRAGNVKQLASPGGYSAQPTQPFGLTLNPDQKNRLASYRIGWFG